MNLKEFVDNCINRAEALADNDNVTKEDLLEAARLLQLANDVMAKQIEAIQVLVLNKK